MNAVCFSCGNVKAEPLERCPGCRKKPNSRQDRVASVALSLECLKSHHLEQATKYIRKTGKLPLFHATVQKTAEQIVEEALDLQTAPADDDSMQFSSSFFEFDSDVGNPVGETVLVHAIGKPESLPMTQQLPRSAGNSRIQTYHTMEWIIGQDISIADAKANMDSTDVLFIWYRWLGNKWAWRCITREVFAQLKNAES